MKNSITTVSALLMVAGSLLAQNETDALRYSQLTFGGTARSSSMGGAFGALGADFSSLSSNPGGLGVYRRSEITVTPGVLYQSTTSTFTGTATDDEKVKAGFNNIGLVVARNLQNERNKTGWKFIQFGIGMNRLANYNSQVTVSGTSYGSIMDQFKSTAIGTTPGNLDPFGNALAFNTYLIDTIPGSGGTGYSEPKNNGDMINHVKSISSTGSYNEMALSVGGNYEDKLFLGGTVGIPFVNYNESSSYVETAAPGYTSTFSSLTYNQRLSTSGSGFNFKIGAIYKPLEYLRLGLAVHSKTWLTLSDAYSADMTSTFVGTDQWKNSSATSPSGTYNYNITTPGRVIGSVGFILGKEGAIDIDYESVDYSQMRLSSSDAGVFSDVNSGIQKNFTRASIVRVGGEWKLKPLALRLGYAYYQSPYNSSFSTDGTRQSFTGGLGFRHKRVFCDLAYVLTLSKTNYYMYDASFMPEGPAVNMNSVSSYMITLGVKL
jgi:hypothetical protein